MLQFAANSQMSLNAKIGLALSTQESAADQVWTERNATVAWRMQECLPRND
jgi:hypothetical protein